MAITAATKLSDFSGFLPPHIAQPYFDIARRNSVVMQLAREVPLSIAGEAVPVQTAKPSANWVAEAGKKPATLGTMTLKTMAPQKLAAIAVISQEVVRADPGGYVERLRDDLGEAFAIAFDLATLHNVGGDGTGTGPFTTFIDQTTKSNELGGNAQAAGGVYADIVDSVDEIISSKNAYNRHRVVSGFAFDLQMETRLRRNVSTQGEPLWTELPTATEPGAITQSGQILGRKSFMGEGVANSTNTILGYAGDWSQAVWGSVAGISYGVSDQATVTINDSLVSLWENNLFAIRAEAQYGFLVNDVDAFIQLRNDSGS